MPKTDEDNMTQEESIEYNNQLQESRGGLLAREEIASILLTRAGLAFSKGNDDRANWFRDLSREITQQAKVLRQDYEERRG